MSSLNGGAPKNMTATGDIALYPGCLLGFYVNSTTAGTVVFRDGGAAGTVISGTITPTIGFNAFPAYFVTSPHATIGGTLDVTFFYQG